MPGVINNIGQLKLVDGYKVYVSLPETLIVNGQAVSLSTTIDLQKGWNFISYLPNSEGKVEAIFNSILSELALVKNAEGRFFIPGVINTLVNLEPGKGYKLYMKSSAVFTYPNP